MSMRRSFTIRPAVSRDAAAVLALVPRLRAFEPPSTFRPPAALDAGEQRKTGYRADFVRYVKPLL